MKKSRLLVAVRSEAQSPAPADAPTRELTLVNVKYEGTNVWVGGPLICKKGDKVKIRLVNNVKDDPAEHGFAIEEFKVQAVVKRNQPETVEFTADKAGIFRSVCHLHLPHVGTQLVVLEQRKTEVPHSVTHLTLQVDWRSAVSRWMMLVLSLTLVASAACAQDVALSQSETRQQNFAALHGADARDTFHGEALGKRLWIYAFGSSVSGDGPHGRLDLHLWGSSATGSSGGTPVNLTAFAGTVRGTGPLGNANLSVTGGTIWGRVGNLSVNVTVRGSRATGFVGNQRFSLSGFDNLNPVGVAVLIGAL